MEIKDVEALAELAKLELNQEEKEKILSDMEGILDYIKQIEEVDVPDVDVKYDTFNVWREDELRYPTVDDSSLSARASLPAGCTSFSGYSTTTGQKCDGTFDLRSQFPDSRDGFVKVKKII